MNWPKVTLSSVARIEAGGKSGQSGLNFVDSGFPAYGAGGLNGLLPGWEHEDGAVILSSIGARCGKCFLPQGRWSSLANTQLIFPDPQRVDRTYLWYQINDEGGWHRSGTAQPYIKPSDVKARLVSLPPLAEQRRISEILSRAEGLGAERLRSLALLDELARATFSDFFGTDRFGPETYVPFGDVISEVQNGFYMPSSEYGSGTPILRIADFSGGARLPLSNLSRVRASAVDVKRFALALGDLVVNRVNAMSHVGKSALIVQVPEPTVFESNMMRIRVDNTRVLPEYVLSWLGTDTARTQIRSAAKQAVNQASVNQKDIAALRLPVPPMDLQRAFLAADSAINSLAGRSTSDLDRLDELFASLRHSAFVSQL